MRRAGPPWYWKPWLAPWHALRGWWYRPRPVRDRKAMTAWTPPEAVCEHCGQPIWQSTSIVWTHRGKGYVNCGPHGFGATRATPASRPAAPRERRP